MSQNKTVIQGLEPSETTTRRTNTMPNFYTRSEPQSNGNASRGTVVPGMMAPGNVNANPQSRMIEPHQPQSQNLAYGKPVVGFLYSVSRTMLGEYWPLHVGQNIIGKSSTCDIVLPEGTVSGEHAVLVVRRMKNPAKVIASISDARSTNGTMLNGESLEFSAVECKNGDIITIGDNYELYLILIDTTVIGLKQSEEFITINDEDDNEFDPFIDTDLDRTRPGEFQPYEGNGGTVGLDGSTWNDRGGTVGM